MNPRETIIFGLSLPLLLSLQRQRQRGNIYTFEIMSWQEYVDGNLIGTGFVLVFPLTFSPVTSTHHPFRCLSCWTARHITKAVILGQSGGVWANSAGFTVSSSITLSFRSASDSHPFILSTTLRSTTPSL